MTSPLSPEQLAVWSRDNGRGVLNIPVAVRLVGLIDKAALSDALHDVIERHEILRTTFPEYEGTPQQRILHALAPELVISSVTEQQMARMFNASVDCQFDVRKQMPVRMHLFSMNTVLHTLLMVFHPLAFDCGSISPLLHDVFEFYSARIEKRKPDLRAMQMQYADYARMRSRSTLSAINSTAEPRIDESDVPFDKGVVPMRINPHWHQILCDFAKESGVSVESVLHAGFAILCARLGLGDSVILNVMESARNKATNAASMVGRFESIAPRHISTRGNPSFLAIIRCSAGAGCLGGDAGGRGCSGRSAIRFRTLFRMKPVGVEALEFPMLKVYVNPAPMTETGFVMVFDLTERLSVDGKAQGIEGSAFFDRKIVVSRQMPVLVDCMMNLLKQGMQNPDARVNDLPLEERPTAWASASLAPECPATAPDRVPMARVATVHDNGRQERVQLTDTIISSAIAAAPVWQQSYVAFQDALQCRLAGIWEETLGISRAGVRDRFADLGGNGAKARRIIGTINKVFRKSLPASLMCGGVTVEALSHAICRELPTEPVSAIQPETTGAKPPLFFVHGDVFGGGLYTVELAHHLGADRPFFSFNPHGLDGQIIPESIEKMAEDYLKTLRRMRPAGPFWLGGFCNGALIAYEMARMLEREGRCLDTPVLLVEAPPGDISEAPAGERESRTARGVAAPPGLAMRKAWVLNQLFQLSGRYRPGRYAGPVTMVQPKRSLSDGVLVRSVWKKVADNLHIHTAPGDHITCIGRHVPELSDILRGVIETYIGL